MFFRLNKRALDYIRSGGKPTLSIIQEVLNFPTSVVISEEHIHLCIEIVDNPVTLNLPVPNSPDVAPFAKIAGPENSKDPALRTPGCYMIVDSAETDLRNSYIGQSVHMGNRVKNHASGKDPRTSKFVGSMNQGIVRLFLLTPEMVASMPAGLTTTQFLCVLEQYLFFHYRPLINAAFVARAGVAWSEQAIAAHRALLGTPIFVYRLVADTVHSSLLELVYTFESMGQVSETFGFERTWLKNVFKRGGWFRGNLFFLKIH